MGDPHNPQKVRTGRAGSVNDDAVLVWQSGLSIQRGILRGGTIIHEKGSLGRKYLGNEVMSKIAICTEVVVISRLNL